MTIVSFLIELAGATMLLLYSVRMVRTGIERAFGASFQRILAADANPLRAALTGVVMAIVLQSSGAVALLVAGFAGTAALTFGSGLAIVLGADLGSALLIQILSFKLEWLVPLLLAVGGGLFIKSERRKLRQAGRIVLGIAFILISLRFLRETMNPIAGSDVLPIIAGFLERDFVTAFIAGAVLAFVMHSSVAAILMCVTVVSLGAIPVSAGVSLVLGANLGSALIPVWLTRGMSPKSQRIPIGNFVLRGSGAIIALFACVNFPLLQYIDNWGPGQTLINTHVLFNALLLPAIMFCGRLEAPLKRMFPDQILPEATDPTHVSLLETPHLSLSPPAPALATLRRETLRMSQVVGNMFAPVMELYSNFDKQQMLATRAQDDVVNTALGGIKHYVAAIPANLMNKEQMKEVRELAEYAIALEIAGDIIAKRFLVLAQQKHTKDLRFSKAGFDELTNIHDQIASNMSLAANVLISGDMESARLLLEEKNEITRVERSSRRKHLKRLGDGPRVSFESSDIHIETLRAFRDFNSQIASVAYPILYRGGQLLETRLIETMEATA